MNGGAASRHNSAARRPGTQVWQIEARPPGVRPAAVTLLQPASERYSKPKLAKLFPPAVAPPATVSA